MVTIDRAVLNEVDAAPGDLSDVVDVLHGHWASRSRWSSPSGSTRPSSARRGRCGPNGSETTLGLAPDLDPAHDRLHFLVWANTYDARGGGEPIWWWGRKALKAGAVAPGPATAGAGRRGAARRHARRGSTAARGATTSPELAGGAAVVPAEAVDAGHVRPVAPLVAPRADLAPDQLAAVAHGSGPARVIAPAGSGKTRVLTERLRHLVVDRGYEPGVGRGRGLQPQGPRRDGGPHDGGGRPHPHAQRPRLRHRGRGARAAARGRRRARRAPRARAARPQRRPPAQHRSPGPLRRGADRPCGSACATPLAVEDERGDVPGLAEAFPRFRAALERRGVDRLRRAGAAGSRAAATRRALPPRPAGAPPPPAGRRVPGPHPGARAAGAAAGRPGVRRVRGGRRRPGDLRPRRGVATIPHRLRRATSPVPASTLWR